MEFNLADLFECVADLVPDAEAVVVGPRRLTYAELDGPGQPPVPSPRGGRRGPRRRGRPAAGQRLRVPRGDARLLQDPRRADQRQLPLRGCRAPSPLRRMRAWWVSCTTARSRRPSQPRVGALAEQRVVLEVDDDTGPGTPSGVEDYESALSRSSDARDHSHRSADDLYCVYTGGTTGMPKGVMWRHEDIFFAAMGGGDPMQLGNVIDRPEQLARPGAEPRPGRPAGAAVHARQRPLAGLLDAPRRGHARDPTPWALRSR